MILNFELFMNFELWALTCSSFILDLLVLFQLKDLKRQLKTERKRADQIQQRLQDFLLESKARQSMLKSCSCLCNRGYFSSANLLSCLFKMHGRDMMMDVLLCTNIVPPVYIWSSYYLTTFALFTGWDIIPYYVNKLFLLTLRNWVFVPVYISMWHS